jgi:hypothetical protein
MMICDKCGKEFTGITGWSVEIDEKPQRICDSCYVKLCKHIGHPVPQTKIVLEGGEPVYKRRDR